MLIAPHTVYSYNLLSILIKKLYMCLFIFWIFLFKRIWSWHKTYRYLISKELSYCVSILWKMMRFLQMFSKEVTSNSFVKSRILLLTLSFLVGICCWMLSTLVSCWLGFTMKKNVFSMKFILFLQKYWFSWFLW